MPVAAAGGGGPPPPPSGGPPVFGRPAPRAVGGGGPPPPPGAAPPNLAVGSGAVSRRANAVPSNDGSACPASEPRAPVSDRTAGAAPSVQMLLARRDQLRSANGPPSVVQRAAPPPTVASAIDALRHSDSVDRIIQSASAIRQQEPEESSGSSSDFGWSDDEEDYQREEEARRRRRFMSGSRRSRVINRRPSSRPIQAVSPTALPTQETQEPTAQATQSVETTAPLSRSRSSAARRASRVYRPDLSSDSWDDSEAEEGDDQSDCIAQRRRGGFAASLQSNLDRARRPSRRASRAAATSPNDGQLASPRGTRPSRRATRAVAIPEEAVVPVEAGPERQVRTRRQNRPLVRPILPPSEQQTQATEDIQASDHAREDAVAQIDEEYWGFEDDETDTSDWSDDSWDSEERAESLSSDEQSSADLDAMLGELQQDPETSPQHDLGTSPQQDLDTSPTPTPASPPSILRDSARPARAGNVSFQIFEDEASREDPSRVERTSRPSGRSANHHTSQSSRLQSRPTSVRTVARTETTRAEPALEQAEVSNTVLQEVSQPENEEHQEPSTTRPSRRISHARSTPEAHITSHNQSSAATMAQSESQSNANLTTSRSTSFHSESAQDENQHTEVQERSSRRHQTRRTGQTRLAPTRNPGALSEAEALMFSLIGQQTGSRAAGKTHNRRPRYASLMDSTTSDEDIGVLHEADRTISRTSSSAAAASKKQPEPITVGQSNSTSSRCASVLLIPVLAVSSFFFS